MAVRESLLFRETHGSGYREELSPAHPLLTETKTKTKTCGSDDGKCDKSLGVNGESTESREFHWDNVGYLEYTSLSCCKVIRCRMVVGITVLAVGSGKFKLFVHR